ncbi:regulator of nonsense transcripts 2 isoform X1, partial [Paramuricea clavata]
MSSQKVDKRNSRNTSNESSSKANENKKIQEESVDSEQKPASHRDENEKDEEELQKEEEEKMMQEQKQAEEIALEAKERVEAKMAIRQQNLEAPRNRPQDSFFRSLDSNIKKNSSFIKKLKTMTEQQKQSLSQEFNGLNLTRFIQEAVTGIVEGLHKLKVSDVSVVIHMCGLFHQRYTDFMGYFITELMKMFDNYNCKDDEKSLNVNKFRVGLRVLAELGLYGIIGHIEEAIKLLSSTLNNITSCDMENHLYLSVILSFCRHCAEDVLGITSRKQRLLLQKYDVKIPRFEVIPSEKQKAIFSILKSYYESLVSHLLKEHADLQKKETQNKQILLSKGELHEDRKEAYEKCQKSYDKLLTNISALAEILDLDMPDLPESESLPEEDASGGINIFNPFKLTEYDGDTGLWEDEDTRTFYENLKDLKSLVPSILYKESSKTESDSKTASKEELVNGLDDDSDIVISDDEDILPDITDETEEDETTSADESNNGTTSDASGGKTTQSISSQLEQIIQRLPTCVNRNFIDDLATDFVMTCNTKGNRKKLCKALFNVPRTRFDLLPFYSRLVATLHPCMPDLAVDLFAFLKAEFKWHVRKKDQIYVESKVKTVRFIAELTKFGMVPKKETVHCLK